MFDRWSLTDGVLSADIEVGIPLTGRTGLGETALLKLMGDIRWRQLAELSGVDSSALVDGEGNRLYATYYYVDIWFPPGSSMADISENDRITIVNTIESDGASLIDGYSFIYPYDAPAAEKVPLGNEDEAMALGVPFIRSSNAFVRMVEGATWLKKAEPDRDHLTRMATGGGGPETHRRIVAVGGGERVWRQPPDGYLPLTDGKIQIDYVPVPDRDLNGLGLLYYANYPAVLDVVEREVLREHSAIPLSDALIDQRAVTRRQSAYMANIVPPDVIDVGIEAWMAPVEDDNDPVNVFLNYDMRRRSDGRRMFVSTAEKVLHAATYADLAVPG